MSDSILFCNDDRTVIIIDIPTSIASSQGGGQIRSQEPIKEPFHIPEPKGPKREAYLSQLPAQHVAYQNDLHVGIAAAHKECQADQWCLPRVMTDTVLQGSVSSELNSASIVLSLIGNDFRALTDIQGAFVFNENNKTVHMEFGSGQIMHIPGRSVFGWTSIERSLELIQGTFDLILMDPPWMNRSVRRSHAYVTAEHQCRNPFQQALEVVDIACAAKGYAAIWITNKAAVRNEVMGEMRNRGFGLSEEWIWSKTTCQGEFVSPLDGVWRKPYEVLLLFRRGAEGRLRRRYIFGVPDLHSRKPSLKFMFQDLLSVEKVLELFARHVTAGWVSIGNEVTLFQYCDQWKTCPP